MAPSPGGLSHRWRPGRGDRKRRNKSRTVEGGKEQASQGGRARRKGKKKQRLDLPRWVDLDVMEDEQGGFWSYHLVTGDVYDELQTEKIYRAWETRRKKYERKLVKAFKKRTVPKESIKEFDRAKNEIKGNLERCHRRRCEQRRRFELAREVLEEIILQLHNNKAKIIEEEKKIKQAKKAEEETIQDKNRSKEIVEWNEECWERTIIWCEAMNFSTQDIDWCPDAEWEFVTQCGKKTRRADCVVRGLLHSKVDRLGGEE